MKVLALPLAFIALMHTGALAEELDDSTLTCVSMRDRFNHGAIPERTDFRGMKVLYITKKNMFTQSATKNMTTGEILGGGASSMGAVFEWNKVNSGNAGLRVKFKGFATRAGEKISYELEYVVKNTLADNVTMTVAEKRGDLSGLEWLANVFGVKTKPSRGATARDLQSTIVVQV